jgi:hypothetical protein
MAAPDGHGAGVFWREPLEVTCIPGALDGPAALSCVAGPDLQVYLPVSIRLVH